MGREAETLTVSPRQALSELSSRVSSGLGSPVEQTRAASGSQQPVNVHEELANLPTIDLGAFLRSSDSSSNREITDLAQQVAECLHQTGCLVVRDPRVQAGASETFLSLLEQYFAQPLEAKLTDCRPDLYYQVSCPCHEDCCTILLVGVMLGSLQLHSHPCDSRSGV